VLIDFKLDFTFASFDDNGCDDEGGNDDDCGVGVGDYSWL
jgi:hypothetical protein